MNILHVTHNYYPSKGGPQYIVRQLSERLVQTYGDSVQVLTSNSLYGPETRLFEKVEPAIEVVGNVLINRTPFQRWHYPVIELANKVHAKATGKELPASITRLRWGMHSPRMEKGMIRSTADVIMATTIIYNFADYPLWRFKTSNPKPFVLYGALHLHKPLLPHSPLITRAKACDHYIANTDFERNELIRYGVSGQKITTIGIGIDAEAMHAPLGAVTAFKVKHGIRETDIVIGYVGRLVKGKGVGLLLSAFRQLHGTNKNVKLLLAGGTTDYVPEIRAIIEKEKLPIILVENFHDSFKPVLFHTLDVFVLASQSESFGIVFLEAWACRKPVVGARMGAIESVLSSGADSLLFTPGSVSDLVAVLKQLVQNPRLAKTLGDNGYKKIREKYCWSAIVAKYRDAYQAGIEQFERAK